MSVDGGVPRQHIGSDYNDHLTHDDLDEDGELV